MSTSIYFYRTYAPSLREKRFFDGMSLLELDIFSDGRLYEGEHSFNEELIYFQDNQFSGMSRISLTSEGKILANLPDTDYGSIEGISWVDENNLIFNLFVNNREVSFPYALLKNNKSSVVSDAYVTWGKLNTRYRNNKEIYNYFGSSSRFLSRSEIVNALKEGIIVDDDVVKSPREKILYYLS